MMMFPGEDRSYRGSALYVDMLPGASWGKNARTLLTEASWRKVRAVVTSRVEACECCGATGVLQAHERWSYMFPIQRLVRLVALCPACHDATHYGRACAGGRALIAEAHLKSVNRWTSKELDDHIQAAIADLAARERRGEWTIDVSILADAGYSLRAQQTRAKRSGDPIALFG